MAEHPIQGLMGVTIEKIRDMVDTSTIIGDPIHVDDTTTIIPVSRVTFGFASGGSDVAPQSSKQMFGGGTGRTVQLVEKVTAVDNAIAALPELVDKITAMIKKDKPAETGNA